MFFSLTSICQDQYFKISGTLKNGQGKKVLLIKRGRATSSSEYTVLDSSIVLSNDSFKLKAKISETNYYSVITNNKGWFYFLAEKGHLYRMKGVYDSVWKSTLFNSFTNQILTELFRKEHIYVEQNNRIVDLVMALDTSTREYKSRVAEYEANKKFIINLKVNFIKKYRSNIVALFVFNEIYDQIDVNAAKTLYTSLPLKTKTHPLAKKIYSELFDSYPKSFDFTLLKNLPLVGIANAASKSTDSSTLVLIDFWATWCKPCIANMKFIDSLYKTKKNISIISISFDDNVLLPKKFLEQKKAGWNSYVDIKRTFGEIGMKYKIRFLPNYILCTRDGNILFHSGSFDEINAWLKKNAD